jgi:pimeloyl-ACP methyl ester carboxylesterase
MAALITGASPALSQAQGPTVAGATTATVSPAIAAEYVHPHLLIDIGQGRKMNLFCMGQGSHTVIFDAGGGDWSSMWAFVQPGVAAHARACSYDRAGMGYSDPSDEPRTPLAIVDDLHKLIHASKIDTPVVLVGHSLGGFNMKLYAALYPEDVAGLVLVDPNEERTFDRMHEALRAKYGVALAARLELVPLTSISQGLSHFEDCAAAARTYDIDLSSVLYKSCTNPGNPQLGPEIATERQKIQVKHAYQEANVSEIANSSVGDPRANDIYAMLFSGHALGDKPLIVLTRSIYDPKNPVSAASYFEWNGAHDQTAALSTRGVNRIVPDTHHDIQIDRPQAVVDAISEVLSETAIK